MNEKEFRQIAQEELSKQIMENLNSGIIFKYINTLEERNKNLEQKEVMLKEKLERDIEDDNCMWVDNKEKIVTSAKTLVDRSAYAKEIKELLGDEK